MSEKSAEIAHAEEKSPVTTTRKPKRHCARFWWIYMIIAIIVILLVILPVIFVALPRKAQKLVNESALEIKSMSLTDPSSNALHLNLQSVLNSNSSYHPRLDAFNASLFLEDTEPNIKPFAYIELPQVDSNGSAPVNIDQTLTIANLEQFTDYTKTVLASEEYRIAVRGRTRLHQGGLSGNVDYNEVVTLKGLNALKGFNVTSFQIKLKPEPDGANLIGQVYIPNPSILTLELGNVTLNLYCTGDFIGTSSLKNLTLKPGNNTVAMRAITNQTIVLAKLAKFPDGFLPIDINGNSSVFNGQHLTYYEDALKASTQHVSLNVKGALSTAGN